MCKELYLKRKERNEILVNKAMKRLVDEKADFEVKDNGEERVLGKQEVEQPAINKVELGRGKGQGKTINIYSNNMNGGLTHPQKLRQMLDWLNKEEPSALLLQETYMTEQEERKGVVQKVLDVHAPGYQIFSAGLDDEKSKGVAVILSKALVPLVRKDHIIIDKEARYIAIPCRTLVKGQIMWLVSIYAPVDAREKAAFYGHNLKKLSDDMLEIASANDIVVIGMDANATRDPIVDVEWEKYEISRKNERMKQLRKDSVLRGKWIW